ncbi:uncharacterized protein LOC114529673 isoform X3 [Dendronephthya gigantea]|uniref:uncharacterized protein LOC114529673 isoform X3 n=1 Tax=Dendronephthya gigantea TaxID=151771 RepID=UPI00106D6066|nr:uncharacterized protein LOC114529673 isoform X3 [Dendronephthya gigantea]
MLLSALRSTCYIYIRLARKKRADWKYFSVVCRSQLTIQITSRILTSLSEREIASNKIASSWMAMIDFPDQYMQDLGDFWNTPVNEYDMTSSIGALSAEVEFLNIDESTVVYKYQSRVRKEAKQRLKNAEVQILVTSPVEIRTIRAWVQREEKAADLFVYNVGRVEFATRDITFKGRQSLENGFGTKNLFEIDLDSIYYDNPLDKRPVYKLAKTDMLNRNRFQVVVQVVFVDNSCSRDFISPAFYCCTQPKSSTKRRTRSTGAIGKQYGKAWNEPEVYADGSQIIDYFEAHEAVIGNLEVKGTLHSPKQKADIAYHFDVSHSAFKERLCEGDVVGLSTIANGKTAIVELSSENIPTIIQAGVISRSAFLEGNIPDEKVTTDRICMMGIVRVKTVGNTVSGERVYASTAFPGKAVSESHSLRTENDVLLGIALENSVHEDKQVGSFVRCFVSFLFGIEGKCLAQKAKELEIRTDAKIEKAMYEKWSELKEMAMCWCLVFTCFAVLLGVILFTSLRLT